MPPETARIEPVGPDFADWDTLLSLILKAFDYMAPLIDPPSSALRLTQQSLKEKASAETGFIA